MKQFELLRLIVSLLDEESIPYMVVGSFASSFHGDLLDKAIVAARMPTDR